MGRTLLSAASDVNVPSLKTTSKVIATAELRSAGQPRAAVSTWLVVPDAFLPLTKVAGKPIANFLGTPYCQRGDVYPSILTESRPAGLVMAVTDF